MKNAACYKPSSDITANVVAYDLELHFEGQRFESSIITRFIRSFVIIILGPL